VYTAFVGPNLDDLAAFPLTIEDKDVTGLNWVIPAAWVKRAPVRFTIRMDCDCRASSVWLKLTPSGSNADSAASRSWDYPLAEPSEVVPVPVGEYHVAVEYKEAAWTPIPVGLAVTAITAGAADLTVTPLQVTAKDPPDVTIHIGLPRREPWVRIKGQVTGLNTASVKATSITLVDGPMRSPIEARINADGTFEFPKVLPGLYVGQLNPGADPFPRTLRVEKSGLRDVKIPMEIPVRKVSGRIKDLTDYVLNRKATVSVMLLDMQLKSRNVNLTDTQLKSGVSTDGTFAFNAVPPGSYQVYVEVCGELCYLASKTRLKVADKDTHNLELPALKSAEQRLRR
jgi:hypothetical protein